ncbi:MAG: integrase catalytic domain-containing protein [Candidatus Saccharimonadales bacterium]
MATDWRQVTRHIRTYAAHGKIVRKPSTRHVFARKYSREDIAALAELDNAHDRLAGQAVRSLCERAYVLFGDERYERLAGISVAHIYNLRERPDYKRHATTFTKTQATMVAIGERRKPRPDGVAGHIRVDTVHQGDLDKQKGVYHINLVDEVTQWEVVVCVEKISEKFMIPALEAALLAFPFVILGFHADNGSEYMNRLVAELLERLRVKLTKSRAYHSGDNGLVETKNGSIIRKALGYGHIPQVHAPGINQWYQDWFVPYLNFHRSCGYRITTVDPKTGKRTHRYPAKGYMTPYAKLQSLSGGKFTLRPGITFASLDCLAYAMSDTDWVLASQAAKERMLSDIIKQTKQLLGVTGCIG